MHCQIRQSDFLPTSLGYHDILRKMFCNGIRKQHLVAVDHVHKQQGRENLGEGADFKDCISIYKTSIADAEMTVSDNASPFRTTSPTTMPTPCLRSSIRSEMIRRISESVGKAKSKEDCAEAIAAIKNFFRESNQIWNENVSE
jgi:hypothetical protein